MTNVFQQYTNRITAHSTNIRGRYELDTESYILDNFDDSPTYREIRVEREGVDMGVYGVRVNMIERMGNIRNILLKPHSALTPEEERQPDLFVGNMAIFEERTWLLFDKYGYKDSGVKLTAMRTNYNLKWIDRDGMLRTKRCYASSSDIGSKSKQSRATIEYNKYDVKLPYGQLYIFIETTEHTKRIDLNQRFIINSVVYEVIGVDNTTHVEDDYGIIQYTIRRVTVHVKDDFEMGIAYNSYMDKDVDEYDLSELGRDHNIASTALPDNHDGDNPMDTSIKDKKGERKRGGSIW